MFEICESDPFDLRNKKVGHHEGKTYTNKIHLFYFLFSSSNFGFR